MVKSGKNVAEVSRTMGIVKNLNYNWNLKKNHKKCQ
jgi:transposase-like protein